MAPPSLETGVSSFLYLNPFALGTNKLTKIPRSHQLAEISPCCTFMLDLNNQLRDKCFSILLTDLFLISSLTCKDSSNTPSPQQQI